MVLTNELNERDNQIALLKKKETHFEQTIQERENLFKQDTMVRMQLGKRLEQVLMDKEEALDQLDALRVSVHRFIQNIDLLVFLMLVINDNIIIEFLTGTTGRDPLTGIIEICNKIGVWRDCSLLIGLALC